MSAAPQRERTMNTNPHEPPGFTEGDRHLAPSSPFHEYGPRKEVTVAFLITVSVPTHYTAAEVAEQLAFSLEGNPYVRNVRRLRNATRRTGRQRKRRHARYRMVYTIDMSHSLVSLFGTSIGCQGRNSRF